MSVGKNKNRKRRKRRMPEVKFQKVRVDKIIIDPEAGALAKSDQMRPYIEFFVAFYSKDEKALEVALEKIEALPLEKRYIWRIVQALDWGFADFDSATVRVDKDCLSDADLQKMNTTLKEVQSNRTVQLCLFLQELYGSEHMKKIMDSAVEQALAYGLSAEGGENENVN